VEIVKKWHMDKKKMGNKKKREVEACVQEGKRQA
jgi:hypothetical protein